MISLSDKSFLRTTLSYSTTSIKEEVFQSYAETEPKANSFSGDLRRSNFGAALKYNLKINSRNRLQVGSRYTLFDYSYRQSQAVGNVGTQSLIDFNESAGTVNNYVGLKSKVGDNMNFVYGLHNMNVLLNSKSTIEPRLAWQLKMPNGQAISAGYGLHSSMESIHNYYARTEVQGAIVEPNLDLDLLKAHHFVLGYEKRLSNLLMAKIQVYYQGLYNLPVENIDTSYYATINESTDFRYTDLVNKGKGANYGVELTLERFYDDDYYFLLNGSLYQSKYTPLDGRERNTLYNGNYLVNLLVGRERSGLGKKKNKTFAVNARVFLGGGQKHVPLLRDAQGGLAVNPESGSFYDFDKAYESSLGDVFQLDFTASYKINQRKATHEIFLSIINATNTQARISEYYDEGEEGSVGYISQFGTFPNLAYRVYF